jgi:Flp pilus assembly CpaE family ATPase
VQAARVSKLLPIVMQPTVKDIRMGRALVQMLEDAGVSTGRILIVVNRYQKRHNPIDLAQIKKIFDPVELVCIGNDYTSAYKATTEGQPLAQCVPRSQLLKDISDLATLCLARIKNTRSEVAAAAR